jgi:hypothetical protein
VQYVGTNYGQDISNELQNKITVTIVEPVHTIEVLTRHVARQQMIRTGQTNIQQARRAQEAIQQAAVNRRGGHTHEASNPNDSGEDSVQ